MTPNLLHPDPRKVAVRATFQRTTALKSGILGLNRVQIMPDTQQPETDTSSHQIQDKQLQGIALDSVLEKRRLDQALNAKEFAVCAGVSYSTARSWFHLPGFPAFHGFIFWQDFVHWRANQTGLENPSSPQRNDDAAAITANLPPRAAQILFDA
jgi:hypothetical protein